MKIGTRMPPFGREMGFDGYAEWLAENGFGAIDAPIIYMATVWWRTAHPELNAGPLAEDNDAIGSGKIYLVLLLSVISFTSLYLYLLVERYSFRRAEESIDELHHAIG